MSDIEKPKRGRPPKPAESFNDFMRRIEAAHVDRDVYAVEAWHPDAPGGIWPGTYSGVRTHKGPCKVTYSDGSTE